VPGRNLATKPLPYQRRVPFARKIQDTTIPHTGPGSRHATAHRRGRHTPQLADFTVGTKRFQTRLLGVLWVVCDLIVNRYGKLNKGLVIPPWRIIQPTKRCGYRYRLSVQGVCTDISLDIKTKHLTETHVRPGAAGLLIGIEYCRIKDSSWMYLTSLIKLPE